MPSSKEYQKTYQQQYYLDHRQERIDRAALNNKARKLSHRAKLVEMKSDPCTDCGICYPHYVMQYDHIGDDKVAAIGEMVARCNGWETILKEVAKCELVCANCHAVRTWARRAVLPDYLIR